MTDYQNTTKTAWSIHKTVQNSIKTAKKNLFKRYYYCCFSTRETKISETNRKRAHASRNINCPAKIIVTVHRIPPQYSRANHPNIIAENWPCLIVFKNNHNHTVDSAAALSKRPIANETIQEILQYFERGHSVSSAYHSFYFSKMETLGNDYDEMMSDRHYFPTKNDFSNIWKKYFKASFGARSGKDMLAALEKNLSSTDTLYKIEQISEHYVVSLCTPMMQRAASLLVQTSEILFVDGTGNCDIENHKLFFFVTQSSVGGIPVGCVITTSEKREVFDVAVKNLIEIMPTKICPSVILTDDDLKERNVLQTYWPNATLLLCTFHVLKSAWKWICASGNNIERDNRQDLYRLFRQILMSNQSEDQVESNIALFFEKTSKYPKYQNYVQKMLERKEVWCLFYRKNFLTRGSNTNNMVEVVFRLFKDIPLERTKAYNLVQLVDFITTNFNAYYKQRLLDVVTNKVDIRKYTVNDKDVKPDNIKELNDFQYSVLSSSSSTEYYVDMQSFTCSCPEGYTGKICKHQSGVIKKYNITSACNILCQDQKIILYKIATGTNPPNQLLKPLLLVKEPESSTTCLTKNTNYLLEKPITTSSLDTDCDNDFEVCSNDNPIEEVDTSALINEWKLFATKFTSDIEKNLRDDPENFQEGVKVFMNSYNTNVKSSSSLLSGLHTAFKFRGTSTKRLINASRKGMKISVQPTTIMRRKTKFTGRRRFQSGKKPKNGTQKQRLAPHNLQECVKDNKSLGRRKIAK